MSDLSESDAFPEDAALPVEAARRTDLAGAVGLIVSAPPIGRDRNGQWQFHIGPTPAHHEADNLLAAFEMETTGLIRDAAISAGLRTPENVGDISAAEYRIGPDAEQWPIYLYELYQNLEPVFSGIGAASSVVEAARWIKTVIARIGQADRRRVDELSANDALPEPATRSIERTHVALTQGAIAALCVDALVASQGVDAGIEVTTFPRGHVGLIDADHPGPTMTYLVRLQVGARSFMYHMNADGTCAEHYLVQGGEITLLPIPELEGSEQRSREPAGTGVSWRIG